MKLLKVSFLVICFFQSLFAQNNTDKIKSEAIRNIDSGLYGDAVNLLNKYISDNPQDPSGYHLRGTCYEKRSQYELAVYDYRSSLKLDSKNQQFKNDLGRVVGLWNTILLNKIVGYEREIEINPLIPDNYLEIGKCYKNLGKWDKAESWYDQYIKREEPSADEVLRFTEILSKTNHLKKGEEILKRFTDKFPQDHRLWSRYGYYLMWQGKKTESIKAFEQALLLRPYFKEAMDGYDLVRGKGYVYTLNDTTIRYNYGIPEKSSFKGFQIDNYYKKLKRNPDDSKTRFKLIDELVKYNRFEEATGQLNILKQDFQFTPSFESLKENVNKKRNEYYLAKIEELKLKFEKNPDNIETILKLSDFLNYLDKKNEAADMLKNYLGKNPGEKKINFKLAEMLAWSGKLTEALKYLSELLNEDPDNVDYNLLFGNVSTWSGDYSNEVINSLELVLKKQPDNYDALVTLANLYYQKNDLEASAGFILKAEQIKPGNPDLMKLQFLLDKKNEQNILAKKYKLLSEAREFIKHKNCDDAINIYKDLLKIYDDIQIKKELAEAYLCAENYSDAISIYNELIYYDNNSYDLLKQRAKIYFWSGDYYNAVTELNKLNSKNMNDSEVRLMLADSYFYLKDYKLAGQIYSEMLDESPGSYILKQRMKWLGPGYSSDDFNLSGFPVYTMLSPEANYYSDNFDFIYSTYGLKFELGLNKILSFGIGGYGGVLNNDSLHSSISSFKGFAAGRINRFTSITLTAGVIKFSDSTNRFTGNIIFKSEENKKYNFTAGFTTTDAAAILYSPFLVEKRLISNLADISGEYFVKHDWKFGAHYTYFMVSDKNRGNRLQIRLGNFINKYLIAGYEYYLCSFKDQKIIYWSPENFESHNIWAEWEISDTEKLKFTLTGKVGYIPNDDFVLREITGSGIYKFNNYFSLQAGAAFSTTVQSGRGYSSTSFALSAFWNF